MKKVIAFLLIISLFVSTVGIVGAAIPEELMKTPENFTAATSISITIDDNSDIRNLIEEMVREDASIGGVLGGDITSFLSALFDYEGKIDIQADISPDYKKVKVSLTSSSALSSVVSSNLDYTVKAKSGLWMDIDMTNAESPKCDIIFLLPTSDKYRYINAGKYLTQENIEEYLEMYNSEETKKMREYIMQLMDERLTVVKKQNGYKTHMDNDDLVTYIDEVIRYSYQNSEEYNEEFDEEMIPSFKNIQILGKDGITTEYTFKNGKLSRGEVKADIAMNLSDIVKNSGGEWNYKSSGIIKIKITEKVDYTKIGTTEVTYPKLNGSNSTNLNYIIEEQLNEEEYMEYEVKYPYSYIQSASATMPIIDGNYYVPLRSVLEKGYQDTVSIDYQKGVIIVSCDYFSGFNTIEMTVGDDKVYVDGSEYAIGKIISVDGVTYVSTKLFSDVFGWDITGITHNMLQDIYFVSFWTAS